uniref:Probable DNA polymerase n=1 Tax=Ganoderma leucocontextum TaxID=1566825 RepID=A0A2S1WBC7_9APHY|nr:DNA polymerase 2 [Ganoderma leucocontextum]AWJ63910.1 DNA polymerase 2 [Ganoderma leucocontextum]
MKNQLITILTRRAVNPKPFSTMDIETVSYKGHQIPLMISCKVTSQTKVFRVKKVGLESVFYMWLDFFDYLESKSEDKINYIFTHNLGGFDGIFLSRFVNAYYPTNKVETIVDAYNKYVTIRVVINDKTFVFMDSLRIFPVSLQSFCKLFSVEGNLTPYNPKWNKPTILEDKYEMKELVKYAGKDSAALYKALKEAQLTYIDKYGVDITSVVSLPALAMKILRLNFLRTPIPILTGFNDYFVRKSYFGGAVDIYKAHGIKCYYYDIRSLYPYAMTKPMPLELIETLTGSALDSFDLNSFFGFIELEIHCPKTVKRPVLPLRWQNRTIYPRGNFSGVYFSEEVKDMVNLGYKIVKVKCAKDSLKVIFLMIMLKKCLKLKITQLEQKDG